MLSFITNQDLIKEPENGSTNKTKVNVQILILRDMLFQARILI